MNCSELLQFLKKTRRRPNRSLSQNFLIDENIARKIVQLGTGSSVLEIGPGPGALTSHLLKTGATVYAIEKDPVFAGELNRLQTPDRRLCSIHADFLDFELSKLPTGLAVVANLPYRITTPILEKLLAHRDRFSHFTLMVQSEVADRITANAGAKNFSSLSLFAQFHCQLKASFKVAASCFYPKPKVDSKVICLVLKEMPLKESALFFAIVRRAFQQRRKMIRVSLQSLYPANLCRQALLAAHAEPDARPETLTLDQWLVFFHFFNMSGYTETT